MAKKNRTIFASGGDENETNDAALYSASNEGDVVTKEEVKETFTITIKMILSVIVAAIVTALVLYATASATVGTLIHLNSGRFVWTERDPWEGGVPEIGDNITASLSQPAAEGFFGKMAEGFAFSGQYGVFQIVAGPYGIVNVDEENGLVYYNDELIAESDSIVSRTLNKEYLMICQEGDCAEGEYYYIPQGYIIGGADSYFKIGS